MNRHTDIRAMLASLVLQYPAGIRSEQMADIPRMAYHVELVRRAGARIVWDIGGGIGLFGPACAQVGMAVRIIDDFNDPINHQLGERVLTLHRALGVDFARRDVVKDGLDTCSYGARPDAITLFGTIEHWHSSPKAVLHEAWEALAPNGTMVIHVPNCVDLPKRVTTLMGVANWSLMADWYDTHNFRGHVREPSVRDLRYIAEDLGAANHRITGRNWEMRKRFGLAGQVADHMLRRRPQLCSDLYLILRKMPAAVSLRSSAESYSTN